MLHRNCECGVFAFGARSVARKRFGFCARARCFCKITPRVGCFAANICTKCVRIRGVTGCQHIRCQCFARLMTQRRTITRITIQFFFFVRNNNRRFNCASARKSPNNKNHHYHKHTNDNHRTILLQEAINHAKDILNSRTRNIPRCEVSHFYLNAILSYMITQIRLQKNKLYNYYI